MSLNLQLKKKKMYSLFDLDLYSQRYIFTFLPLKDLIRCERVSKSVYLVINSIHQTRKSLIISSAQKLTISHKSECENKSHHPANDFIKISDPTTVLKVCSKFPNLTAIYLVDIIRLNEIIGYNLGILCPKLEHVHFSPMNQDFSILFGLAKTCPTIKHLVVGNKESYGDYISYLDKLPKLEYLGLICHQFDPHFASLYSLESCHRLEDLRIYCFGCGYSESLKKVIKNLKQSLIKLHITSVILDQELVNILSHHVKHLKSLSLNSCETQIVNWTSKGFSNLEEIDFFGHPNFYSSLLGTISNPLNMKRVHIFDPPNEVLNYLSLNCTKLEELTLLFLRVNYFRYFINMLKQLKNLKRLDIFATELKSAQVLLIFKTCRKISSIRVNIADHDSYEYYDLIDFVNRNRNLRLFMN